MALDPITLSSDGGAWAGEIQLSLSGLKLTFTVYVWKTDGNASSGGIITNDGYVNIDGERKKIISYDSLPATGKKNVGSFTMTIAHGTKYTIQASVPGLPGTSLASNHLTCNKNITISHSYSTFEKTVDPTCTARGYDIYKCSCSATTKRNYTDALGHQQVDTVISPTCTEQGYTTHTCSRCKVTLSANDNFTNALGHAWDDGEIIIEPTYTTNGEMLYTCTVCNTTRTEVIAKKVGSVRISNGSTFDIYMVYVYGQDSSWGLYVPYIYNGTSWDLYS